MFSFAVPGDLALKMTGILGEFFVVSVSQETKHEKSGNCSGKIHKNSVTFFRSAPFLT